MELSATCYRTCETSGTLQIQIQRSGNSADPAYVAIQVRVWRPSPSPTPSAACGLRGDNIIITMLMSAFVLAQVEEGSAKPGSDFTHSTAGLIQFDPGETLLDSVQVPSLLTPLCGLNHRCKNQSLKKNRHRPIRRLQEDVIVGRVIVGCQQTSGYSCDLKMTVRTFFCFPSRLFFRSQCENLEHLLDG